MKTNEELKEREKQLVEHTAGFCRAHLDEEYAGLSEKLIKKMSRKRHVPYETGRLDIWAAAIIYALARINFLFDKKHVPHTTLDDIANHFGVTKGTFTQKGKAIIDMFGLFYWDEEFSSEKNKASNPFKGFVMIDGLIVNVKTLKPERQDVVRSQLDERKKRTKR